MLQMSCKVCGVSVLRQLVGRLFLEYRLQPTAYRLPVYPYYGTSAVEPETSGMKYKV